MNFVKEAAALLEIAQAIESLPDDETRCRALAAASLQLGMYDEAQRFITLAKRFRDERAAEVKP